MKKIFRKNQIMITALALMLAVAGYFSFMNKDITGKNIPAAANADLLAEEYEISDEDVFTIEDIFVAEELIEWDTQVADNANGETLDAVAENSTSEGGVATSSTEDVMNPGETVFTSSIVTNIDYASEMKLSREQIRSKNKETLLEIINNSSISDDVKQDAINKMIAMTDIAERENAAEMLLEAKGFTDVVVSITDDTCDVVLNMGDVTDAKRAQVEDIVKRKTNIAGEKIVITPIVVEQEME
ncbi:MAG: SpoIIIAH-like family protein [Roseburia sp.]|nr:SpoIIIAH-like family protein [Roseburia sp.]